MSEQLKLLFAKNKREQQGGLYSVCCANEWVLRAAMRHARLNGYLLLLESTSNQVNQLGGYTGMQPQDFANKIWALAELEQLSLDQIILGGDHLGPLPWQACSETEAMAKAEEMVRAYVMAGYTKLHLDTSMRLGSDDAAIPLSPAVCARRGAQLAAVAMQAHACYKAEHANASCPVFVIGSEVPIPGGSHDHEDSITPTAPEDFLQQLALFQAEFAKQQVPFSQVVAFVVQPGVEFGDDFVCLYDPEKAARLIHALQTVPDLVFEGHSTDYQTKEALRSMVQDGVAILKVGPALTFALREGLLLLEAMEQVLITEPTQRAHFKETLLQAMDQDDQYWRRYYHGEPQEVAYKKLYSFSDRCRYYLPHQPIQAAIERLFFNLSQAPLPLALVSQYFPQQYQKLLRQTLDASPEAILLDRIGDWCTEYLYACQD